MNALITGIHHISLNTASDAEYRRVRAFYAELLGLPVAAEWATGCLLDTGAGRIEIINNGREPLPQGVLRHFAFAVADADACADTVRAAGYVVTVEPKDVVLGSEPPLPARIAFCRGPLGEEIEFFAER